jgi:hypothetical protein
LTGSHHIREGLPTIRSECESWLSAFSGFCCPLDAC